MNKVSTLLMTELQLIRSLAMKLRLDAHQRAIFKKAATLKVRSPKNLQDTPGDAYSGMSPSSSFGKTSNFL